MSQEANIIWVQGEGLTTTTTILVADATVSVSHASPSEVTEYTLEDGSDASDHIVLKPETMQLELVQTEAPLPSADRNLRQVLTELDVVQSSFEPSGGLAATLAVRGLISAGASALGFGGGKMPIKVWLYRRDDPVDRIPELHDALLEMRDAKALLNIAVGGKTYQSYALTEVSYSQTGPEEMGRFALSLRRVRKAPSSDTALGAGLPSPGDLALKAAIEATKKLAQTTPASVQEIKEKSLAAAGIDFF